MPAMTRSYLYAVLTALMVSVTCALSAQMAAPFSETIRLEDLRADLHFLAGDGFRGRLVGSP